MKSWILLSFLSSFNSGDTHKKQYRLLIVKNTYQCKSTMEEHFFLDFLQLKRRLKLIELMMAEKSSVLNFIGLSKCVHCNIIKYENLAEIVWCAARKWSTKNLQFSTKSKGPYTQSHFSMTEIHHLRFSTWTMIVSFWSIPRTNTNIFRPSFDIQIYQLLCSSLLFHRICEIETKFRPMTCHFELHSRDDFLWHIQWNGLKRTEHGACWRDFRKISMRSINLQEHFIQKNHHPVTIRSEEMPFIQLSLSFQAILISFHFQRWPMCSKWKQDLSRNAIAMNHKFKIDIQIRFLWPLRLEIFAEFKLHARQPVYFNSLRCSLPNNTKTY